MIAQLLNRNFLASRLDEVVQLLDQSRQDLQSGKSDARAESLGITVDDIEQSRAEVEVLSKRGIEKTDLQSVCIARDPVTSIVQSALEAFYEEAHAVDRPPVQGLAPVQVAVTNVALRPEWAAPEQRLGARLDQTDARWAFSFLAARGLTGLRGKHAFPAAPPAHVKIANKARVLLVGDWGSGLPRAKAVGERMRAALDDDEGKARERHVIHLGDVYFSGFEREYKNRFLPYWPVRPDEAKLIGSWSLNGNHDMFSGGYGYFDFLLQEPRFARQAGTSYFCLENDHWQIFGLDSAYDLLGMRGDEGDLYGPQAMWLALKRAASPKKKTLLLTHHQLFSAYEGGSPNLEARLQPIAPVTAWFWGHEHLCAVYSKGTHSLVQHPRLLGHGGVPVAPHEGDLPPHVDYEFRDSMQSLLNRFTRFGFAVLDFDEGYISVKYVSELGDAPHHTEVIA
jgi:hypothetical protein